MAYLDKSILGIIKDIDQGKLFLPALQRKFVWKKYQIELLFDSIMRNFPIGTFLFWNLKREDANNYVFYEFLKEYDERSPYNKKKEGSFVIPDITGVLDGQQRLSSIYIGLQGTHTEKVPYMHYTNPNAYRTAKLYINLLNLPYFINDEDFIEIYEDKNFEFRFLSEDDSKNWINRKSKSTDVEGKITDIEETMYWFRVGELLTWKEDPEIDIKINQFLPKCKDDGQKKLIESNRRYIKKSLETLYRRIAKDELISYFEISKKDLEDILKIFVRVNSGGTQLNKTDLLFSTIVATWENGRAEIENCLKKINQKGDGFNFSNEFLMRCCLVLSDSPVLYKVNSFKTENVQRIKVEWNKIACAVEKTVDLLVEFGFSQSLLTSQNATIIIAYYIYKGGIINDFTKKEIKKYLIHSLLKGIYGTSQDHVISTFRNFFKGERDSDSKTVLNLERNHFSFTDLLNIELPSRKSLYVTDEDIDNFLTYKKGAYSFFVLSLLYPQLRYKDVQFHQDHIHPAAKFCDDVFNKLNLATEQRVEFLELRDMIPNLQLMEGKQNESKNATPFIDWFSQLNKNEQMNFSTFNFIPENEILEFSNFKSFFEARKIKIKNELKKVLAINNKIHLTNADYLDLETQSEDSVDAMPFS